MKKLALLFLCLSSLITAATHVSFKMELNGKKYSDECVVHNGEFTSKQEDGVVLYGQVGIEEEKVALDLVITKDDQIVSKPTLITSLGDKAKVRISGGEKTFRLSIYATQSDQ